MRFGHEGFVGVPSFAAGALAVGVISGAYQAEVFRAAYLAISRGELEAAVSVGMNRRADVPPHHRAPGAALRPAWAWQSLAGGAERFVADFGHRPDRAHAGEPGRRRLDPSALRLSISAAAVLYLVMTLVTTRFFDVAEARATRGMRRAAG